jgi:hypothetical protein
MSEAFSWMVLLDIAVNAAYEMQTKKNEPTTGWHYDAFFDRIVVTDVDKAAQSLSVGTSITFEYKDGTSDVYTLGEDGKWRDSAGDTLFMNDNGTISSTKGMV